MHRQTENHGDDIISDPAIFRELMNRSNDSLSVIDLDTGYYIYVNDKSCRSTGYTPEEFRRMTVSDIDPTVRRRWDPDKERRRRRKNRVFVREGTIRRKDGASFPVEISSSGTKKVINGIKNLLRGLKRN